MLSSAEKHISNFQNLGAKHLWQRTKLHFYAQHFHYDVLYLLWTKKAGITQVQYEMLKLDCPWCAANDGVIVDWNKARILPPPECVCETANYGLTPCIDWFADID